MKIYKFYEVDDAEELYGDATTLNPFEEDKQLKTVFWKSQT